MGGKTITSIPIPRLGRLDSQNGLKPQGHSLFILWARINQLRTYAQIAAELGSYNLVAF